jgi:hypothetical protein
MKIVGSGAGTQYGANPNPGLNPDRDPLVRGTDPRIRIHMKISRTALFTSAVPVYFVLSFS